MSLEIEKKFLVMNFENVFKKLKEQMGAHKHNLKYGFWWCNNQSGTESILEVIDTKILKKDIVFIKDIGEFLIPVQDFQYIRLRIFNNNNYFVTLKNKAIINNIEQNTEYEFKVNKETFTRIALYLEENAYIFYYNIKESWEFNKNDAKIEISKLNDLKESYIEVEAVGNDKKELLKKIDMVINEMADYELKEEVRSYAELSYLENREALKRLKLLRFSKDGFKILKKYLC